MLKFQRRLHANLCVCFLALLSLACAPRAFAQCSGDFYLLASPPNPSTVDPGINSVATITLGSTNGFNCAVALSCSLTPVQPANAPTCTVSPGSDTPPSSPSLTFVTSTLTPPANYKLTVTGVNGALTHTVNVNAIEVTSVSPDYTLAVGTAVTPTSVHAGSGATAVLSITPGDGYSGKVTPGCSAISPAVEPSPICSFSPATVTVTNGAVATTTLTINTVGPATTTTAANAHPQAFYALLFPLPLLAIAGFAGAARPLRKILALLGLCMIAAGLVALPACNASKSVNNGSVTPNNSYTFTITAYDANGVAASNTSLTVSLTVD